MTTATRSTPEHSAAARLPGIEERLLRQLEWTVLRRLDGLLQGDYRTLLRGAGLDLADLREYQPEDDIRYIDWNVTARMNSPYVRQYVEDREITAWFLLEWLAGYGERPSWVAGWMLLIVTVCAFAQGYFGIQQSSTGHYVAGPGWEWPSWGGFVRFLQALYFSVITFTTTGYGDLHPVGLGQAVSALEAVAGAVLMALFMVCLARKFSR